MKSCIVALLLLLVQQGWAQDARTMTQAVHYIKLANTLRAVHKAQASIDLLKRALPIAKRQSPYWEAATNELLGLSYGDLNDPKQALPYLEKARSQYAMLKYVASGWAVNEVIRDIAGKNVYAGIQINASDIKVAIFKTRYESEFYEKDIQSTFDIPNNNLFADASRTYRAGQDALRTCLDSIQHYNIPNERIFVVLGNEVRQRLNRMPDGPQSLYAQLSQALPNGAIRIDTTLGARREAELFTIGAIPRKVWPSTSALNLGEYSTTGGYIDDRKTFAGLNVPVGVSTLVKQIDGRRSLSADAFRREASRVVRAVADTALLPKLTQLRSGLQQRSTVGVGGDIALAIVTYLHPDQAGTAAVPISMNDVERFQKLLTDDYRNLTRPNLSDIADPVTRNRAEADVSRLLTRVNEKELIAGVLWLESIMRAYSEGTAPKRFVFIRDADISWVTGKFLETINYEYESTIAKGALYTR